MNKEINSSINEVKGNKNIKKNNKNYLEIKDILKQHKKEVLGIKKILQELSKTDVNESIKVKMMCEEGVLNIESIELLSKKLDFEIKKLEIENL